MTRGGLQVTGLREAVRALEQHGVDVLDLKAAFQSIGLITAREADARVPKITGRTASTIRPSRTKNKSVVRAGGNRAPGTGPLNYGRTFANGTRQPATRFLNKAADATREEALDAIERNLEALARKVNLL